MSLMLVKTFKTLIIKYKFLQIPITYIIDTKNSDVQSSSTSTSRENKLFMQR